MYRVTNLPIYRFTDLPIYRFTDLPIKYYYGLDKSSPYKLNPLTLTLSHEGRGKCTSTGEPALVKTGDACPTL